MKQRNLAVNVLGDLSLAPRAVQQAAADVEATSRSLPRVCGVLNIMFVYTATHELARAVEGQRVAEREQAAWAERSSAQQGDQVECASNGSGHRGRGACHGAAAGDDSSGADGSGQCSSTVPHDIDSVRHRCEGGSVPSEQAGPLCSTCCNATAMVQPSALYAQDGARPLGAPRCDERRHRCSDSHAGARLRKGKHSVCTLPPARQNGCAAARCSTAAPGSANAAATDMRSAVLSHAAEPAAVCALKGCTEQASSSGRGGILWDEVDGALLTAGSPPVDLLLRTSGESRLSDFLVWQCRRAYLCWVDDLWPALGVMRFLRCVLAWQRALPHLGAIAAELDAAAGSLSRDGAESRVHR